MDGDSFFWQSIRHRRFYLAVAAFAAIYVPLLVETARTRKPWNDEAMAASAAYNLSTRGETGVDFFDEKSPFYPGIRNHTYYIFPLQLCVLSVWYKIVGFSLFSTRLISILWMLLMLAAVYSVIQTLTGDVWIAQLAVVLTALDYQMMIGAAFGRYDTMVAALGFAGYALYLRFRERNLRAGLVAGNCCVAMAGATHPNGLLFFIGLWFLIFYFDRKRIGWKELSLCALPYVVGGGIWARFILQDLPSFRGQLSMNAGNRIGILHPLDSLLKEIRVRYIAGFGLGAHSSGHASPMVRLKALSLLAYVVGILGCLLWPSIWRRNAFRAVLLLAGIHFAYMTFYEHMKFSYYLVHLLPLYCAMLAIFAVTLWRFTRSAMLRWAVAGALATVCIVPVGGILAKIRIDDYHTSYLPAVEFVRQHAAPADQVNASCSFGFGYGFDHNLMDDASLGYYNGRKPEYLVAEEIYDDWWGTIGASQPDLYRYAMTALQDYDLIYDHAYYRVYRRRAQPTAQIAR